MRDRFGREIDYLRISVTDRCNLRCIYCRPAVVGSKMDIPAGESAQGSRTELSDGDAQGSRIEMPCEVPYAGSGTDLLTDDQIVLVVRAAARTGVRHIRLTGGEPLLRAGLGSLVRQIKDIEGIETVDLTTNGFLLEQYAVELANAGLRGVNVSLDSTDAAVFSRITGADISPDTVLSGIDAAAAAGLKVKINSVLTDINKDSWPGLAELAKFRDVDVRFIELMPIGSGKEYVGVSNRELMDKLSIRFGKPERVDAKQGNGPACYRRFPGFKGSIGFISAIHGKFCDSCNRIRLTSSGILKSCLCYDSKLDLLARIRSGATEEELAELICEAIMNKPEAHCFEVPGQISEKRSMSQIGG